MKRIIIYPVLLGLSQIISICLMIYALRDYPMLQIVITLVICTLLCIFSDIQVRNMLRDLSTKKITEEKEKLLSEAIDSQIRRKEELENNREKTEKIKTDILDSLTKAKERLSDGDTHGAQTIMENTDFFSRKNLRCSINPFVDAIVSDKKEKLQNEEIELNYSEFIRKDISISGSELCAVFSNLVDNAANEVRKCINEDRIIDLRAKEEGGYLVVKCTNLYLTDECEESAEKNEDPLKEHGWGLSIIEMIAERHDGKTEISKSNGRYTATVWLAV